MCGDGAGGLYVLNEDTYTDPDGFDKDLELANTVLRLGVDANGNTTTRTVLSRITDESIRLACDRFAPDQGGRVFIANAVDLGDSDCRDKREELLALRKNGNGSQSLLPRLDAIEGVGECDFEDEVTHLEVSGDGSETFASFESGGIWRVRPSPLQFVDSSFADELFRLHPDGSVIFVTVRDGATKATVNVYKVTASQVAGGALPVGGLPPCATIQLPNNRKGSNRSRIAGLGVSPQSANSRDATILVSVTTTPLNRRLGSVPGHHPSHRQPRAAWDARLLRARRLGDVHAARLREPRGDGPADVLIHGMPDLLRRQRVPPQRRRMPHTSPPAVISRLPRLLRQRGMTWAELGRRAQLTRTQLARLGDQHANPRLLVADRIARALELPVESIWQLGGTPRETS